MNIATIVFIAIVAFFIWRGYEKGFIGSITRILSWVIAYPAAIFFTKPLATIILQHTPIKGLLVYLIAGCSIFLVVSLSVSALLNGLSKIIPDNQFTDNGSKVGGAIVGLCMGSLVGLVAVYLIGVVKKPDLANAPIASENIPVTAFQKYATPNNANDSFIETNAKKLVGSAAATAVNATISDDATTQMTKAFIEDPQVMFGHVQQISNNGELKALFEQPDFQAQLNTGDINTLMQNQDFQKLMGNSDVQALVASADNSGNGESPEKIAAEKMINVWQKMESLKNNPRVMQIIADPEFQEQLDATNKLPLMLNPKLKELTDIMFNEETTSGSPGATPKTQHITTYKVEDITENVQQEMNNSQTPSKGKEEQSEKKLYRWTDENGRVHFSDKPVKN